MHGEHTPELVTSNAPSSVTAHAVLYLSAMRGIFIGHLSAPITIRHPCPMLAFALEHAITANGCSSQSFLIAPDTKVTLHGEQPGRFALVFLDGSDGDYWKLHSQMHRGTGAILRDYQHTRRFIARLLELDRRRPAISQATTMLSSMISLAACEPAEPPIEPAVQRLLTYLRLNPVHDLPLKAIAKMERISEKQLAQRFVAHMGISIRDYQLWRRLFEVTYRYHAGSSLRNAAEACGFDSLTHFSMYFRNLYGVEASIIFGKHTRIIMNRYGKTL